MDMVQVHTMMSKSMLIKTYRRWLLDNKTFNKGRKYGKLRQPIINGRRYSWSELPRLPKDVILVHMISVDCGLDYMQKLEAEGFYTETREWHTNFGNSIFSEEEE